MRKINDYKISNSPYVETLIDPQSRKAYYPDFDQTTAHLKTILMNGTLRPPIDDFLIVFRPLHPNNNKVIQIFGSDPAVGGYTWIKDVPWDEDLSQSYTKARIISACLKVLGNTVAPSVNFTIAGVINASDVQTLPDLRTLTFQSIPSFRRNPRDVVLSAQLMDGVTSLHHPEGQNPFRILESNSSENTNNYVRFGLDANDYAEFIALGVNPGGIPAYLWSVADGNMPSGLEGYVTLDVMHSYRNNNPTDLIYFRFIRRVLDPTDWATSSLVVEVAELTNSGDFVSACRHKMYFDSPLESIEMYFPAPVAPADFQFIRVAIEGENYYQLGYRDPATLIGVSGFVPNTGSQVGQCITLAGVANYEATPDETLSRQIDTDSARSEENPLVLMQVLNIISKGYIKFLWNDKEYQLFKSRQKGTIADLERLSNASGLGDLLKTVIGTVAPIVTDVANTVLPGSGNIIRALTRTQANATGLVPFNAAGIVPYRNQPNRSLDRNASMLGGDEWEEELKNIVFKSSVFEPEEETLEITWNTHSKRLCCDPYLINNITTGMRAGQWRNVAMSWHGCIFPYVRKNDAYLGAIICSTTLMGNALHYLNITYKYGDDDGELTLSSDFALEEDSIKAIIMAHVASGQPGMFVHVKGDPEDPDDTLSGGSLGLAAFTSFLKRPTFAAITGAVNKDLEFYTPTELSPKSRIAEENSLILLVGGTPGAEDEEIFKEIDPEVVCTTNDIAFGDVNADGVIKPIWSIVTVPSLTLATIYSLDGLNYKNINGEPPRLLLEEYTNQDDVQSFKPVRQAKDAKANRSAVMKFWDDNKELLQAMYDAGKLNIDPGNSGRDAKIRSYTNARDLLKSYEKKMKESWEKIRNQHGNMFANEEALVSYGVENWSKMMNNAAFRGAVGDTWDLELFKVLPGYLFGAISTYISATRPKGGKMRKYRPKMAFPVKKGKFETVPLIDEGSLESDASESEEEVKLAKKSTTTRKGQVSSFQQSMFGEPVTPESLFAEPPEKTLKVSSIPKKPATKIEPVIKGTTTAKAKTVPTPSKKEVKVEPQISAPTQLLTVSPAPSGNPMDAILSAITGISTQMNTLTNRMEKVEKKSKGGVVGVKRNAAGEESSSGSNCASLQTNCSDRPTKKKFMFYPTPDQKEVIFNNVNENVQCTNQDAVIHQSDNLRPITMPICDCACYIGYLETLFSNDQEKHTIRYATWNNQPLKQLPPTDSRFNMVRIDKPPIVQRDDNTFRVTRTAQIANVKNNPKFNKRFKK